MGSYGPYRFAGQLDSKEVEKGVKFLVKNNLNWKEEYYTAVGFLKFFI